MVVQVKKVYRLGEFTLDPDKKLLSCEGAAVHLANRPFQVLLHLIDNRDRMVSRAELLDQFWDGKDVYENTLTKCVGAIRKALDDTLEQPRFIETQWAKGYRFIGGLEERYTQARQSPAFEMEKSFGLKVLVEEEYLEILPDREATVAAQLADEKMESTTLPAEKSAAANLPAGVMRAKLSRPALALAVVIALVVVSAIAWLLLRPSLSAAANPGNSLNPESPSPLASIAVLPLKNLSDDAANEYFSDGLTETFITELAKIEGLKVISRNSVFTLKGKDVDPIEVGRKFDVATILEGSVRKNGDTVRVDVRLVNTRDGSIIWSGNSYDRALKDILAVQDEIACSVAAGLRVKFCGGSETAKHYTGNVDAYQAYLQGRYHWNKRSPEGIKESVGHFARAIAADPNYALAYAGLADSYIQGIWHVPFNPAEVLPKARAAALQAIQIDEQLAEAHTALANVYQMEWRWAEAGKEIERAIALNPGLARAYHVQTFHLNMADRHEEAVAAIKRAQILDPLNPVIDGDQAFILGSAGHHEEALAQALKVIEMNPGFGFGHRKLSELYLFQGREAEAAEEYFQSLILSGKSETLIAGYRKAHLKNRLSGVYQKELEEHLHNESRGAYSSLVHIASLYTLMGQKEQAFKYLEKAYRQRSADICVLKDSPVFIPLHTDPRYADLLRRIGLHN